MKEKEGKKEIAPASDPISPTFWRENGPSRMDRIILWYRLHRHEGKVGLRK